MIRAASTCVSSTLRRAKIALLCDLTSCSHRGVVNAIRQAQVVAGVQKVHAVIGGFHLAPYQPDYIRQTIAALEEIGPDYVVPLHCSGEALYEMMKAEIPTKLVRAFTGTRLIF